MNRSRLRGQPLVVRAIWATLAIAVGVAMFEQRWSLAFVAIVTFAVTLIPILFVRRLGIQLPVSFVVAVVLFTYATIFLGEAFDFYTRYWWWDVVLHAGSAMGFGLVGFLFVFTLFNGDRYAAPAWAMATIAMSFAVTLGVIWEIFEYAMDVNLGLNMQKSGLRDTMWDLIVDVVGASIGAASGFFYLKGRNIGGMSGVIGEFIANNRRFFRKPRK